MMIEQIFPNFVGTKSKLYDCLMVELKMRGLEDTHINTIVSLVPKILISAPSFLDKITNIWRYEFGVPYTIRENLIWGSHMWVPVNCLLNALLCANSRLPKDVLNNYLERLANLNKHQAVLVEMIPGCKVDLAVPIEFEVPNQGIGNHTIDWVIRPHNSRIVLLEVKRRVTDFIKQTEQINGKSIAPEPNHDPTLLFRSVEEKFKSANPDLHLQGIWIVTDIKQNEQQISVAFAALDSGKVHFAIFGDWKSDAFILARRSEDEQYLRNIFHIEKSARFTF